MTDERYRKIMADFGMPNSRSLLAALQQVAQESVSGAAVAVDRAYNDGVAEASRMYSAEIKQLRKQVEFHLNLIR